MALVKWAEKKLYLGLVTLKGWQKLQYLMIGGDLGRFLMVCDSLCLYVTVSDAVG